MLHREAFKLNLLINISFKVVLSAVVDDFPPLTVGGILVTFGMLIY